MTTLLAFAFVLGVLVFVHELGHFLMARWHGVRVLTFSLGFGPKLLKVRRGGTEYALSAMPLGGYVKMAGENPEEQRTGSPDEFLSKTKWQRFQILIMGPAMNIALAVVLLWVVLMQGARRAGVSGSTRRLSAWSSRTRRRRARDFAAGDRILRVNGKDTPTWDDFFLAIGMKADRDVELDHRARRPRRAGQGPARSANAISRSAISACCLISIRRSSPWSPAIRQTRPASRAAIRSAPSMGSAWSFQAMCRRSSRENAEKPMEMRVRRGGAGSDAYRRRPTSAATSA